MRFTIFILFFAAANASWFGSNGDPEYNSWSTDQLKAWLVAHNVDLPSSVSKPSLQALVQQHWNTYSTWSTDQYDRAQKAFQDYKADTFDAWDESALREFLLEQGVVAPSGPREQLVLLAKGRHAQYTSAASALSASASASAASVASGASTAASDAYATVTSLSGDASSSVSSAAAQATASAVRALDDSKDYVYSTWDDNRLRSYLEEQGAIKTKSQKNRDELLKLMHDKYAAAANPVWEAWADSYIHEWLAGHNIVTPTTKESRTFLADKMQQYYYTSSDTVWSTWSDSELHDWLVEHGVIKSEAQIKRDKLVKLVSDNYNSASSTLWEAWSDSDLRAYLSAHVPSASPITQNTRASRNELLSALSSHTPPTPASGGSWFSSSSSLPSYLTWPDARLRANLRAAGVPEERVLGVPRGGLLQEMRVQWEQGKIKVGSAGQTAEDVLGRVKEAVGRGVGKAEERLAKVLEVLGGYRGAEGDEL